jgi:TPR repeat protein
MAHLQPVHMPSRWGLSLADPWLLSLVSLALCLPADAVAQKQDANALYRRGCDLHLGRNNVAVDHRAAFQAFRLAAELKHPAATYMAADYYRFSYGAVPCDMAKAIRLNADSEELGYPLAAFWQVEVDLKRLRAIRGDRDLQARLDAKIERMVKEVKALAEKGDPFSQGILGQIYSVDQGVRRDPKQSFEWHRKAAEQNLPEAMFHLGSRYDLGDGVEKDPKLAVEWYKKAIDHGHLLAIFNLGRLHESGTLGKTDLAEARRWYRRGAELGEPTCQHNFAVMLNEGRGGPMDREEALRWYRKAATEFGFGLAIHNLQQMGLNPYERPDDDKDARSIPPPSGAIVLFGGSDLKEWVQRKDGRSPAHWKLGGGNLMEVAPGGDIQSTRKFGGHFMLHVEFRIPKGEGIVNSGVYLQGRHEVQIYESYGKDLTPFSCGAIYNDARPLFGACKQRGVWQTFDIEYWAPRYEGKTRVKPARISVNHNDVNINYKIDILKDYTSLGVKDDPSTDGPIILQQHTGVVEFRNIWVKALEN